MRNFVYWTLYQRLSYLALPLSREQLFHLDRAGCNASPVRDLANQMQLRGLISSMFLVRLSRYITYPLKNPNPSGHGIF